MLNLLYKKLYALQSLRDYTKEILSLTAKIEDEKISIMISERKNFMDNIDLINIEIDRFVKDNKDTYIETDEIKFVKNNMKEIIKEIINMDKLIRNDVNAELKKVKSQLYHPETISKLNVKI